jgi:hypothetical protein
MTGAVVSDLVRGKIERLSIDAPANYDIALGLYVKKLLALRQQRSPPVTPSGLWCGRAVSTDQSLVNEVAMLAPRARSRPGRGWVAVLSVLAAGGL